jgi:hypothetical protein
VTFEDLKNETTLIRSVRYEKRRWKSEQCSVGNGNDHTPMDKDKSLKVRDGGTKTESDKK